MHRIARMMPTSQAFPSILRVQIRQKFWIAENPIFARRLPLIRLISLMAWKCESIVAFLIDRLLGHPGLGSHCINGDKTPSEYTLLEEQWKRWNLIRPLFCGTLCQDQTMFDRPGADYMERLLARSLIM